MNCTENRVGFKCLATDMDAADKFRGTITNKHSTNVSMDIFSVVDTCERINRPRPPGGRRNSTTGGGRAPNSSTILVRQLDRDTKVPKGGSIPLNLQRVKVTGYCSKTIVKNCRTDDGAHMVCGHLISIS